MNCETGSLQPQVRQQAVQGADGSDGTTRPLGLRRRGMAVFRAGRQCFGLALLALFLSHQTAAAAGDCPALPPRNPMPREAVPEAIDQPDWTNQVTAFNAQLPELQLASRKLVFIGDSLTAGWDPGLFSQFYGARAPLLMGIRGDYTQGLLSRLPAEWGPLRPKLVVLMIGVNNIQWGGSKPEDVALGTAEIVRLIHARSPATKVLIIGMLPRGADPSDPLRQADMRANEMTARCADGRTTFYVDAGRNLMDAAGHVSNEVAFDLLHLTPVGYAILATTLEPTIKQLMGD